MIISRHPRVAALYDIHGNLPALDAVLADVRAAQVDLIVIGGDVMFGPMPRECLQRLLDLDTPARFISGNCDREMLAARRGVESASVPEVYRALFRWAGEQIAEFEQTIASWPATISIDVDGIGAVLFCHATPRNDVDIFTRLTPEDRLLPIFAGIEAPVVVCGHTHMQFDRHVGRTRVVNAGSVGMSFQGPGAFWLLLGIDGVQLRRTSYDLAEAAMRVRETPYPSAEEFAMRNILDPPTEASMLDIFQAGP
jgi:putative phosphoesterase